VRSAKFTVGLMAGAAVVVVALAVLLVARGGGDAGARAGATKAGGRGKGDKALALLEEVGATYAALGSLRTTTRETETLDALGIERSRARRVELTLRKPNLVALAYSTPAAPVAVDESLRAADPPGPGAEAPAPTLAAACDGEQVRCLRPDGVVVASPAPEGLTEALAEAVWPDGAAPKAAEVGVYEAALMEGLPTAPEVLEARLGKPQAVGEARYEVLELTLAEGVTESLWIDAETHLIHRRETTGPLYALLRRQGCVRPEGRLSPSFYATDEARAAALDIAKVTRLVEYEAVEADPAVEAESFALAPPDESLVAERAAFASGEWKPPVPEEEGPLLGQLAPDFAASDLTGRRRALAELEGRPIVLLFLASWCGHCWKALPAMNELQQAIAEAGPDDPMGRTQILGVVIQQKMDRAELRSFAEEHELRFPLLAPAADEREDLCRIYDVRTHPRLIVIAVDGLICMDVTRVPEAHKLIEVIRERATRPDSVERDPGVDLRGTRSAHLSVSG
jgi:peroxiredoxin